MKKEKERKKETENESNKKKVDFGNDDAIKEQCLKAANVKKRQCC